MKFQEFLLEMPSWDGGIDERAAAVLEGVESARFSTEFPSGLTIEDADHAISQMTLQDGNASNLAALRQIVARLAPVRSAAILFI